MAIDSGPTTAELGVREETTPKKRPLPEAAKAGEVHLPKLGMTRQFDSFEGALAVRLGARTSEKQAEQAAGTAQTTEDAKEVFTQVSEQLSPQINEIISEMKTLGIHKDILAPKELSLLAYGLKADQLGDAQRKDKPQIKDDRYEQDPTNPLYELTVDSDGKVHVVAETPPDGGDSLLNTNLNTQKLEELLTKFHESATTLAHEPLLQSDPQLRQWVEQQAVSRNVLMAKGELKPSPIALEGATFVKGLNGEVAQSSNEVQLWKTPEGRKLIVKGGAPHTLQAEVLENRAMAAMGLPVPETYLDVRDGEPVLIVGFLDAHVEEENPFVLSEKYHTNRVLQRGLIADLWLGQYNRRAHNLMMKDGKVAFIDHGAATFARASGGFKEFNSEITDTHIWDIVRTIPDHDPNTDEPVNEAYGKIMTVRGGPDGKVVIKDPHFMQDQLRRLGRFTDEQITEFVEAAGYEDGDASITQMQEWIDSKDINGKIAKLLDKRITDGDNFTDKDERDLRWTEGAKRTMEAAIAAGGMRSYMINTLRERRDNIVEYFEPLVENALKQRERPKKRKTREVMADPEAFSWESVIPQLQDAKDQGKTIVVTNGHFVLFHPGHSVSLEQARDVAAASRSDKNDDGVVLLAIVNADHQTHAKGAEKGAAQSAHERAIAVHNDMHSDHVVISEAPEGDGSLVTDFQKLADAGIITEDMVYVKGGDYSETANRPPEADIVVNNGGVFTLVDRVGHFSTSSILDKILTAAREGGKL